MSGCTIRVHFKAYRDCSSTITNVSPITTLAITANSGCILPARLGAWVNVSNTEVTPVCPGTPTRCNTPGAAINGIMEHYWVVDYNFCSANCPSYKIEWSTCCRNANITTLVVPNSLGLYASTTVSPFLTPCNSAPVFNTPPVPVICQGQSYVFSQGATDPDGDSIAYSLGPCMRDSVNPVIYLPWVTPNRPLGPDWIVTLDSVTGDLIIRPDPTGPSPGSIQVGVLCVYVQEWRGGQLINTIVRDLQLTVIPCPPNNPPTTRGFINVSGAIGGAFSLSTCLGATLCADIRVEDLDAGQIQKIWWNQSLAPLGATFALSTNPLIVDTIYGSSPTIRFCWTPTVTGSFNFTVTMHDNACPTYGINQYNFHVDVTAISVQARDSVVGCESVNLCALPQAGTWPYSFIWTGPGGLSTIPPRTDSCFSHTYPAAGNYPYVLTVQDAIGCTAVYRDTIVIANNVSSNAGPNISACSNQAVLIGLPPQPGPNLIYSWSPPLGMSNSSLPQPSVVLSNNLSVPLFQNYILTITDTVTHCFHQDTLLVTVFPIPESPFNIQSSACQNEIVGVAFTGSNPVGAIYNWTFAAGNPATATGQGPHQVSWPTPGQHDVSLTVVANGCSSPTEIKTITIIPNPQPQIAPVPNQCLPGNSFNFSNIGIFGPTATHAWTFWPNATPTASNSQNPNGISFATPGVKLVTVTTTENGCTSPPDTLNLIVYRDPNANWAFQGGVQCFLGNSYQFVAAAGNGPVASYSWTFQDGTPSTSTDTLPVVSFGSPGPKTVTLSVTAFGCTSVSTGTVMVFPEPMVAAGPGASFCAGDGGADLFAVASGGTAPYYYTWWCGPSIPFCGIDSINDDDPHVNPSQSEWYYVQVSDANGCLSGIDSVFVTINPKPVVDAGPDLHLCGQGAPCQVISPLVSGSAGPFSYQWQPSAGLNNPSLLNPCARPDTTTIYALIATDLGTGCTSEYNTLDTVSTVVVNVHPVPVADAGPDRDICFGDSIQIQGVGFGAGPLYQYQWSPSTGLSSTVNPTPMAAAAFTTFYSLVVWSNGCPSYADTMWLNVHTIPTVSAGWDREICLGDSTQLDASSAGDSTASYTFHWIGPPGLNDHGIEDPMASPPRSAVYYVVATSNWGCSSAMDSVAVILRPSPIADAGPNLQTCFGDSARLLGSYFYTTTDTAPNPSQVYFAWSPANAMSDSTQIQPNVLPQVSGWYTLEVRHNLCLNRDSVLVTVIPALGASAAADTAVICSGDSVQLHGGGGFGGGASYQWSPAGILNDPTAPDPIAFPASTTTITLILQEAGCHDSATVLLTVIPRPEASILHSALSGCAPFAVSFMDNSSNALAWEWNFGDGSPVSNLVAPVHTYVDPGTYSVSLVAQTAGACASRSAPVTVQVAGKPDINAVSEPSAPAIIYLPHASVSFGEQGALSSFWTWDFGDGIQSVLRNPVHAFTRPGTYFVRVRSYSVEGCTETYTLGPFEVREPELSIPNVFSPNGDGQNDIFLASYLGNEPFGLTILDRWGKTVHRSVNKLQGWDGSLSDGMPAPEGVYYYRVAIADREYVGSCTLFR